MKKTCVVFYLPETGIGDERPLMLQEALFCPALEWCARYYMERGARRFYVVSGAACQAEALACFPDPAIVSAGTPEGAGAELEEIASHYTLMEFRGAALPVGGALRAFGSLEELDVLSGEARGEIAALHRRRGVRIPDPASCFIDPRAVIGAGTVLLPGTMLVGSVQIGRNCRVGPYALVRGGSVGDGTEINASQVYDSELGERVQVGPYAHIRPHCQVGDGCKVGAYVEIKNARLGAGTKLSHLTYVGDAQVGERVNFGCGTITSNYDGFTKARTVIGDDVFVGCNTNLVAPVTVEDGAYIAAGTTVTRNVERDSMVIGRVRQETKPGWAKRWRALHGK